MEINETQKNNTAPQTNANENANISSDTSDVCEKNPWAVLSKKDCSKIPKNKWTALILCFFLGWLGIHKFYEGKLLMGVVYFLTLGLCGIGWVVDFIIILCFKPVTYY